MYLVKRLADGKITYRSADEGGLYWGASLSKVVCYTKGDAEISARVQRLAFPECEYHVVEITN